ncbi:MAG: WbqC family protein, partial [Nanoarchaeota archaeon]|nr:WbqC family protein [Nanoarchaeota archaeon]
ILTAHQPVYLPWLGLFHKIYLAEKYCIFDGVQYQTRDFNNRNKIKTRDGVIWLTVPVESKNHFSKKISEIKIIKSDWNRKHFKSIFLAYKKAKFFDKYITDLEYFYMKKEYNYLVDICSDMLIYFLEKLNISRNIDFASKHIFEGEKSELVLNMCQQLGADSYIFGAQGKNYAEIEKFKSKNISIYFQNYLHPIYSQLFGEFQPNLSIIDLLFNHGDESLDILLSGNIKTIFKEGENHWI